MKTRKTFLVLLAVVVMSALAVTFLPQKSLKTQAATQDTVSVGLTFGSAIAIAIGPTSITPSVTTGDTGTTNDSSHLVNVSSNDASGVHITLSVASSESTPVADRLCNNPDYIGDCDNTDYFLTDQTASYININAQEYGTAIPGVTYYDQDPLDTSGGAVTIMDSTATSIDGSGEDSQFFVIYDFYGDYTIVAQVYNGVLTFDIISGT